MARLPVAKIRAALDSGDVAPTTKEKGDALVSAIELCLCSIPGLSVVHRSIVSDTGSMEIDIVLYNSKPVSGAQFMDHIILVESKNWSSAVDCKAVRDFIGKIRAARRKEGILVAASGITGDPVEVTNARDEIRQAYDRDGIMLFVLTRTDIESFSSMQDLLNFLRSTYAKIMLRKNVV